MENNTTSMNHSLAQLESITNDLQADGLKVKITVLPSAQQGIANPHWVLSVPQVVGVEVKRKCKIVTRSFTLQDTTKLHKSHHTHHTI